MRAVNLRHGDDHAVNLTGLRAVITRLHVLADYPTAAELHLALRAGVDRKGCPAPAR